MKKIKIIVLVMMIVLLIGILRGQQIVNTKYQIDTGSNLDVKISQISDFHSNDNPKQVERIISLTKASSPDYIVLSGDILESFEMISTLEFVDDLQEIAPVIYARGNHEDQYDTYQEFEAELKNRDVIVLDNAVYQTNGLNFIGFADLDTAYINSNEQFNLDYCETMKVNLGDLIDENMYNVLIAHRPNYLDCYQELGADLVLAGHAHGGQWQIPMTDIGLIAPDDGLFTNNVHGLKVQGETKLVINSGTSNPYAPIIPRLFNPMEVVTIELN